MNTVIKTAIMVVGFVLIMASLIIPIIYRPHSPALVPLSDLSKLVLVCEKAERNGDGYYFFRVYRFEDKNNLHYIVMNTSGGIAIK